jgi:hypothetical protein
MIRKEQRLRENIDHIVPVEVSNHVAIAYFVVFSVPVSLEFGIVALVLLQAPPFATGTMVCGQSVEC